MGTRTVKTALVSLALGTALHALAASAQTPEQGESPAAQAGHNLYEQHCMICHGLRAQGDGALASELRVRPKDLTTISLRRGGVFPEAEVREIIDGRRHVRGHGPANMPLWGKVFENQSAGAQYESDVRDKVTSLVTYLKSIQKTGAAAPAPKEK